MSINRIIDDDEDFPRKYLGKNLTIGGILAGSVILAGSIMLAGSMLPKRLDEYFLGPKDFENATWEQVDNEDGTIWDDYTRSGIPQNSINWAGYHTEVRNKNPQGLTGKIYIPIFDDKKQKK